MSQETDLVQESYNVFKDGWYRKNPPVTTNYPKWVWHEMKNNGNIANIFQYNKLQYLFLHQLSPCRLLLQLCQKHIGNPQKHV